MTRRSRMSAGFFFGTGFSCDPTSGSGFKVLAQSSSALSRTGIDVALYLAIAAVFLVVGAQLVFFARRRRRLAAQRRAPDRPLARR